MGRLSRDGIKASDAHACISMASLSRDGGNCDSQSTVVFAGTIETGYSLEDLHLCSMIDACIFNACISMASINPLARTHFSHSTTATTEVAETRWRASISVARCVHA